MLREKLFFLNDLPLETSFALFPPLLDEEDRPSVARWEALREDLSLHPDDEEEAEEEAFIAVALRPGADGSDFVEGTSAVGGVAVADEEEEEDDAAEAA